MASRPWLRKEDHEEVFLRRRRRVAARLRFRFCGSLQGLRQIDPGRTLCNPRHRGLESRRYALRLFRDRESVIGDFFIAALLDDHVVWYDSCTTLNINRCKKLYKISKMI